MGLSDSDSIWLALDLGTHTGFAVHDGRATWAGTHRLATANELKGSIYNRCWDVRFERLYDFTSQHLLLSKTSTLVWEDVQFVHSSQQINVWTTLRSAVWAAVVDLRRAGHCVTLHAVPVGTLKKHATGSGSADKTAMLKAAVRHNLVPAETRLDDNAIDAVWLLHYITHEH